MIKLLRIIILGQSNSFLDLKKRYDKTFKNIPTVSEDFLEIIWKYMKTSLII